MRIVHFSFRDGQPREFLGRPGPLPLVLEIHVEVNNPSSFDFSPLGQLQSSRTPAIEGSTPFEILATRKQIIPANM